MQAGAAMAFVRGKDILVPYYRDLGLALGIGLTPYEVLLSLFARAADHSADDSFRITMRAAVSACRRSAR